MKSRAKNSSLDLKVSRRHSKKSTRTNKADSSSKVQHPRRHKRERSTRRRRMRTRKTSSSIHAESDASGSRISLDDYLRANSGIWLDKERLLSSRREELARHSSIRSKGNERIRRMARNSVSARSAVAKYGAQDLAISRTGYESVMALDKLMRRNTEPKLGAVIRDRVYTLKSVSVSSKSRDDSLRKSARYTDASKSYRSKSSVAPATSAEYSRSIHSESTVSMVYASDKYRKAKSLMLGNSEGTRRAGTSDM